MAKICIVNNCNYNVWGKGYCKNHQYLRSKIENKEPKDRGLFIRSDNETNVNNYKKALQMWFNERHKEMTVNCQNECGRKTLKFVQHGIPNWKFSVCHILPKSPTNGCPSVACEQNNVIYLCNECHQEYDSSWEKAKSMKVWHLAKMKAKTFIHLIPFDEYKKFLDYFK